MPGDVAQSICTYFTSKDAELEWNIATATVNPLKFMLSHFINFNFWKKKIFVMSLSFFELYNMNILKLTLSFVKIVYIYAYKIYLLS